MATEHNKISQADVYNEISTNYQAKEGMKLMELACVEEGSKVLDLGCGTGRLTVVLADRVGSKGHVVGIDPDKERLKTAREKNSRANITYIEADGETFPEGQYDLVFSNYVIHWIKDKEPVFKRVSKNLCPGGKFAFVITMEHASIVLEALKIFAPEKLKLLDSKLFQESLEKLENRAIRNGFVVTYKKLDTNSFVFPNVQGLVQFLHASSGGQLSPERVSEEMVEIFWQKRGDRAAEVKYAAPIAFIVLSRL